LNKKVKTLQLNFCQVVCKNIASHKVKKIQYTNRMMCKKRQVLRNSRDVKQSSTNAKAEKFKLFMAEASYF